MKISLIGLRLGEFRLKLKIIRERGLEAALNIKQRKDAD